MNKILSLLLSATLIVALAGCENVDKQDIGVVTGGVLGGALGNQVGGGTGRVAATIGGTILGAFLGGAIGKNMDDTDRLKMNQAIETSRTNQTTSWQNPDSGNRYEVTPTRTYSNQGGQPCRDYVTTAYIGGKKEKIYGTACRMSDGSWQATN